MRDAVKLSVSLMNCPLTLGKFGITSTKNVFLINATLADLLRNFDVILIYKYSNTKNNHLYRSTSLCSIKVDVNLFETDFQMIVDKTY